MSSLIVVHADFEAHWPFVAEDWYTTSVSYTHLTLPTNREV